MSNCAAMRPMLPAGGVTVVSAGTVVSASALGMPPGSVVLASARVEAGRLPGNATAWLYGNANGGL